VRANGLLVILGPVIFGMVAVGCTSTSVPATAPPTAPTTAATSTTTTTVAPPSTTVPAAPITTVDRVAEIEAIFQDLEQRRLDALYRGDREAFSALFANEAYLERDLESFELSSFDVPPGVSVEVLVVLEDTEGCIAARRVLYRVDLALEGPELIAVMERTDASDWGFSYVGEGWACEGSHPLGS